MLVSYGKQHEISLKNYSFLSHLSAVQIENDHSSSFKTIQ